MYCKYLLEGRVAQMELTAVAARGTGKLWAEENIRDNIVIFDDAKELMCSGLCEAVIIATPHYSHPELAIEAFEQGLHVLCEKPAGVYSKQVRSMNEAAVQSGLVFGIMFNQRTNSIYRKVYELVHSGELGAIKRVNWIATNWYRTQAYYDNNGWRATWAGEGGGVLINQCPHNLDLLQWICGMPTRVMAFCHNGKWHNIEVEDDVTAYLEFPGGATGVFVTSTGDAPGTNRLELTMEKGRIICEDDKLSLFLLDVNEREHCFTSPEPMKKPGGRYAEVETDGSNEQQIGVLKAFAGKIRYGTPLVAEGVEGIRELILSNAMYLSSWLGGPVELPFDEELFLEELNKRCSGSSYGKVSYRYKMNN
jgi:predicted dehydrogenase